MRLAARHLAPACAVRTALRGQGGARESNEGETPGDPRARVGAVHQQLSNRRHRGRGHGRAGLQWAGERPSACRRRHCTPSRARPANLTRAAAAVADLHQDELLSDGVARQPGARRLGPHR
eukprot:5136284-Prymnesium_polylepis.1